MSEPSLSSTFNRIALFGIIGAIVGLLAGFLLHTVDVLDNPFTLVSVGIAGGACMAIIPRPSASKASPPAAGDQGDEPR